MTDHTIRPHQQFSQILNIHPEDKLTLAQQFELVKIMHETKSDLVLKLAANVLTNAINPRMITS